MNESVYDKISNGYYEPATGYPTAPSKPRKPGNDGTSMDYALYANELKEWEDKNKVFKTKLEDYRQAQRDLQDKFKRDALDECGITNHPKAEKAFNKAWDRGHSEGLRSVLYELEELAEIMV